MKTYKGTFVSDLKDSYTLEVKSNGFIKAFILLTADAIRGGKHFQLDKIECEDGSIVWVDDLLKIATLLKN